MSLRLAWKMLVAIACCVMVPGCAPWKPMHGSKAAPTSGMGKAVTNSAELDHLLEDSGQQPQPAPAKSSMPSFLSKDNPKKEAAKKDALESELALARLGERRGQSDGSKQLYLKIIQSHPTHPTAYHRLGVICARESNYAEANRYFEHAVTLGKPSADLLSDLGYSYYLQSRFEDSEKVLKQALRQKPNHEASCNNLGLVLGAQGRFADSFEAFKRVNSEAEAHANVAFVFSQQGDLASARKGYLQALSLDNKLREAAVAVVQVDQRLKLAEQQRAKAEQSRPQQPPAERPYEDREPEPRVAHSPPPPPFAALETPSVQPRMPQSIIPQPPAPSEHALTPSAEETEPREHIAPPIAREQPRYVERTAPSTPVTPAAPRERSLPQPVEVEDARPVAVAPPPRKQELPQPAIERPSIADMPRPLAPAIVSKPPVQVVEPTLEPAPKSTPVKTAPIAPRVAVREPLDLKPAEVKQDFPVRPDPQSTYVPRPTAPAIVSKPVREPAPSAPAKAEPIAPRVAVREPVESKPVEVKRDIPVKPPAPAIVSKPPVQAVEPIRDPAPTTPKMIEPIAPRVAVREPVQSKPAEVKRELPLKPAAPIAPRVAVREPIDSSPAEVKREAPKKQAAPAFVERSAPKPFPAAEVDTPIRKPLGLPDEVFTEVKPTAPKTDARNALTRDSDFKPTVRPNPLPAPKLEEPRVEAIAIKPIENKPARPVLDSSFRTAPEFEPIKAAPRLAKTETPAKPIEMQPEPKVTREPAPVAVKPAAKPGFAMIEVAPPAAQADSPVAKKETEHKPTSKPAIDFTPAAPAQVAVKPRIIEAINLPEVAKAAPTHAPERPTAKPRETLASLGQSITTGERLQVKPAELAPTKGAPVRAVPKSQVTTIQRLPGVAIKPIVSEAPPIRELPTSLPPIVNSEEYVQKHGRKGEEPAVRPALAPQSTPVKSGTGLGAFVEVAPSGQANLPPIVSAEEHSRTQVRR